MPSHPSFAAVARLIEPRFDALRERSGVPGAALGVLSIDGDRTHSAVFTSGVTHLAAPSEVTDHTVFQLGSITKVWTATLIMQLVDEGAFRLDDPVARVLPEFVLADDEARQRVTIRHLLTHRAGFTGDVFVDTGSGTDALARYVALLSAESQLFPPGELWSYNNAALVVAGRIVEVYRKMTWSEAVQRFIATPLALGSVCTRADEAIMRGAAVGHLGAHVAPVWSPPASVAPAGGVIASAPDLLRFAEAHLRDGALVDGSRLLSTSSVRAMREHEADLSELRTFADSWGIGWFRDTRGGALMLGHDGVTIGQMAFLRTYPEHGMAIALLTNGNGGATLAREIFQELTAALPMAATSPMNSAVPASAHDLSSFAGTYAAGSTRVVVSAEADGLRAEMTGTAGQLASLARTLEVRLVPVGAHSCAVEIDGITQERTVSFHLAGGKRYLAVDLRMLPCVA